MNPKIIFVAIAMAAALNVADAIWYVAPAAATAGAAATAAGLGPFGVSYAAGVLTLSSGAMGLGAIALGGLVLVKAAAIAAVIIDSQDDGYGDDEGFLGLGGGRGLGGGLGGRGRGLFDRRHKRSAGQDEEVKTFRYLSEIEPEQCYQRLICDLATGRLPKTENEVILALFKGDATPENPKFRFEKAAQLGSYVRDIRSCEVRFSCPLSGNALNSLLK